MEIVEITQAQRTPGLIDELTALWRASVEATHRFLNAEQIDALAPSVPGILVEVPRLFCARAQDGSCLGFGGVSGDSLDMLFVDPSHRGEGVGTALLAYGVEKLGVRRLDANEQNPAALGFYESRGFVVVSRSETDDMGNPYPLLHMELSADADPSSPADAFAPQRVDLSDACCQELADAGLALVRSEAGLVLQRGDLQLMLDFSDMLPRLKQGAIQRELLVRAARVKGVEHPVAVDATAGLGQDSLLLAAAGFTVHMYEADPVIAALLRDGLRRAAQDPVLSPYIARMCLHEGDSVAALHGLSFAPDVVYLDPMFPGRTKSAAVKKKFQLLHHLERPCENEEELLQAALAAHPRKIVVKRPVKGPHLAGIRPSHSLAGKAVRYDCIVPPRKA